MSIELEKKLSHVYNCSGISILHRKASFNPEMYMLSRKVCVQICSKTALGSKPDEHCCLCSSYVVVPLYLKKRV